MHKRNPNETCATMLINRRVYPEACTPVEITHPDITAIKIKSQIGTIMLFNIYNAYLLQKSTAIEATRCKINKAKRDTDGSIHIMVLGDLNRHHQTWEDERNAHLFTTEQLDRLEEIINLMTNKDLELLLPHGTPTLQAFSTGNLTRPDNTLGSTHLANRMTKCDMEPENRPPKTDYFSIPYED